MSLAHLDLRGVPASEIPSKLPKPPSSQNIPTEEVGAVLAEVRTGGDSAVRAFTEQFDGVRLDSLRVPHAEVQGALESVDHQLCEALELAYSRVLAYHRHQPTQVPDVDLDGVTVTDLARPVRRVGLYVPGGRARYPSTVLMCAAPARVAGVGELAMCVPPGPDGLVARETLAAAAIAGITEVYRIGGAQAVAALAFGTESIPAVDVIAGPGNRYVTEAKRQVSGLVGVPAATAGPSEVVVVADDTTPPQWAAVDVVVQAEHGPDGLAWLVTWSEELARAALDEVARLVEGSPRRAELEATLESGGSLVMVDGPEEAISVANVVAPEHLELLVDDAEALLPSVRCAGAVFCGPFSPASVGDYLAGPNHVLPTARTARFSSSLRVDDFLNHIHSVRVSPEALERLAPHVASIALSEGLPAHALSVQLRTVRSR